MTGAQSIAAGAQGLAAIRHYVATYRPQQVSTGGIFLGMLLVLIFSLAAARAWDIWKGGRAHV